MIECPFCEKLADLEALPAHEVVWRFPHSVALLGAWRQWSYGNVRIRPALLMGLCSAAGVAGGTALASSLPEHVLRILFGCLLLGVAARLAWSVRRA